MFYSIKKILNSWGIEMKDIKENEINAVHEDDLLDFLKSIKEYDSIAEGKRYCYFCSEKITIENIYTIFPLENQIRYCCNKVDCYIKSIELNRGKNG